MLKWLLCSLVFCCGLAAGAQRSVQTVVPVQPIAVGAAFQVQYIVTGSEAAVELQSPAFGRDFRFVSGPRLYQGQASINNHSVPIQNFSYTLIPLRKGRLVIKGATAIFKDGKEASAASYVSVTDVPAAGAVPSAPLSNLPKLAPGATWDASLRRQLFIKTAISRQSCFIGEPVEVTFTLFSRLLSASEVIKNPGFYGFSVLDKPDAAAGQQTIQTYNGAFYNTQILRQVQLYPAQAGHLVIDKISVSAAIEYTDSASGAPVQTAVVLESEPIPLTVKPLPAAAPQTFDGAVGLFAVKAQIKKQAWPQNSSGQLEVTVKGAGNFVQLSAPEIAWPEGFDVFEPKTSERLQKEVTPVAGSRTYIYTFTADSAGTYHMPPIAFTYFNPKKKAYETAQSDSVLFTVQRATARTAIGQKLRAISAQPRSFFPLLVGLILALSAGLFLLFRKRFTKQVVANAARKPEAPNYLQIISAIAPDDALAYRQLQQALMGFLKSSGQIVAAATGSKQPASLPGNRLSVQAILDECEAVQYFNAQPSVPFRLLQQQALDFIKSTNERPHRI